MAERLPLLLSAYLALVRRSGSLFRLVQKLRLRSGKDDPARARERFGYAGLPRPEGKLIWIHAASVGETVSILPLLERFVEAGARVLLTTVTRTSAELAQGRLPEGAAHQFACYDHPPSLRRFLDHWKPDLALVVESEVWPATYLTLAEADIPLALVNGRMSNGSHRNWRRARQSAACIFGCLKLALAQSEADGKRLEDLGVRDVRQPGNLKFDGASLPVAQAEAKALEAQIGGRGRWLAALTHPGEDEIALQAHEELLTEDPELLLVLVPRHPARAEEIERLCADRGLKAIRRSSGETVSSATQVYIGDTIGEMGLFYHLCQTLFLAGSFAKVGGHNPLEALRSGCALVSGPKVANARTTYQALWAAEAVLRIEHPEDLASVIRSLLKDEDRRAALVSRGAQVIADASGAVDRSFEILWPLSERRQGTSAGSIS